MTDPIDRLRSTNPMREDDVHSAPMALADRIMRGSGRPSRASGFLVATSFATAVVAVGAVWLLWLGNGEDTGPIASDTTGVVTSTTVDSTTTQPGGTTVTTAGAISATTETQVRALLESIEIIDEVLTVNSSWEAREISYEDAQAAIAGSYADAEAVTAGGEVAALVTRVADTIDAVSTGLASPDDGTMRRNAIIYLEGLRQAAVQMAFDLGADVEAPDRYDITATAYFLLDPLFGAFPEHPTLIPVERQLPVSVGDPVETALRALFAGVGAEESQSTPRLSTALPSGISILGVYRGPAVVSIDLTGITADQLTDEGLAQIVYTATRIEDRWVAVTVDGIPVTEDTLDRDRFESLLPAILIDSPAVDQQIGNPVTVSGTANVFEATVSYALTDWDGVIIAEGFTTATCGTGCRGDFSFELAYDVDRVQPGALIVWESSALDGSQTNVREHAVVLTPSGDQAPAAGLTIGDNSFFADDGTSLVDFTWPVVTWTDNPAVAARVNASIQDYVRSLNASALEPDGPFESQPGEFGLAYRVLLDRPGLLTVRFDEYGYVRDTAHPWSSIRAFVFDLTDGSVLPVESFLDEDGVARVEELVQARVEDSLGTDWQLEPRAFIDDVAVVPGGLVAFSDENDGLPHAIGPVEVAIPWSDIESFLIPGTPVASLDRNACSTSNQRWAMNAQDDLPDPVNAARAAIFSVAVSCDYATLAELTSDAGFAYSFGGGTDPAGFFAEQEFAGTPLMRILVATLNMSYSVIENPDGPDVYTWPGAFVFEWDATTPQQRDELASLYGENALEGYAEFGAFIGWRVGIDETGEWVFFIAGD